MNKEGIEATRMSIDLQQIQEGSVYLRLSGRLTNQVTFDSDDVLTQFLQPDPNAWNLLLDMSDIQYLDSSGVGWLIKWHKRLKEQNRRFILHSLSAISNNTIRLLKLETILDIAKNEREATGLIQGATNE